MDMVDAYKSDWIDSVKFYVKESQGSCLNLRNSFLEIEEFKAIFDYLPGSQIDKLYLPCNKFKNGIQMLSEALIKSDIRKLLIFVCDLTKDDAIQLMTALKFTKITELDIRYNHLQGITSDDRDKLISLVLDSHVKILKFNPKDFEEAGIEPLIKEFLNNKISTLKLHNLNHDALMVLVSNLQHSSLTKLTLHRCAFDEEVLKAFSQALRKSGVTKLNIGYNDLEDNAVNILVEGLVHSKVYELKLCANKIQGSNTLGLHLKDTPIKILQLNYNTLTAQTLCSDFLKFSTLVTLQIKNCHVGDAFFQQLARCLKFSRVVELEASNNNLGMPAISELAKVLKDTNLERVCLARNELPHEVLIPLAEGIVASKLKYLNLDSSFKSHDHDHGSHLPFFITRTKSSNLNSLDLSSYPFYGAGAAIFVDRLVNIKLTRLSLFLTRVGLHIPFLAENLKSTALAHLNLGICQITDEGATVLASFLKKTQLIELNLSGNEISCHGAKALALSLKDSSIIRLNLNFNKIQDSGCKALAQGAENTFVTSLSLLHQKGDNRSDLFYLIDAVLRRNEVLVERLTNTFKQIAPDSESNFRFARNNVSCVSDFFKNCLELYMIIIQKPIAINVVMHGISVGFSKAQIVTLMEEEFPKQFCNFIATTVEATAEDLIDLLKKAEEWKLNKVVELFLLYRPLYLIDRDRGILHPYFYKFLHKYDLPLYSLAVEPEGKTKLINYFTKHGDIDGATDIIRLLCCEQNE